MVQWQRISLRYRCAGDVGSIPESGRSLGEGNGNPLHRGAWWLTFHGVAESDMT